MGQENQPTFIILKMASLMVNTMAHYILGEHVSDKDGDFVLNHPVRIMEVLQQDGRVVFQFMADGFFASGKDVKYPLHSYESVRYLTSENDDVKLMELYNSEFARFKAAKIGLIMPETKVPQGDLRKGPNGKSLRT